MITYPNKSIASVVSKMRQNGFSKNAINRAITNLVKVAKLDAHSKAPKRRAFDRFGARPS
jgi:hypothetical protein